MDSLSDPCVNSEHNFIRKDELFEKKIIILI